MKKDNIIWIALMIFLFGVFFGILFMYFSFVFNIGGMLTNNHLNYDCSFWKNNSYCQIEKRINEPLVIGSNLYIGYEDGKRVGYNYWNGTWYKNGEPIK